MTYKHTTEGMARRTAAWTCPECSATVKAGGKGPHLRYCGANRLKLFWDQVDKTDGCWLWKGWQINSGYGETAIRCRKITVHRYSYQLAYGAIPKGMLVLHKCDVPTCVRPDHLFLGTDADNCADKVAKRRHVHGERMHTAKLTEADVREIRSLRGKDLSKNIAARFGVAASHISNIWARRLWKHVQ